MLNALVQDRERLVQENEVLQERVAALEDELRRMQQMAASHQNAYTSVAANPKSYADLTHFKASSGTELSHHMEA